MTRAMLPCENDVEQMNASELRALLDQHGSAPKDMAPKGRLLQLVRELLAHARKRAAEAEHAAAVLEGRSRYARHADEPQAHQVVDETVEPFRAWCNECRRLRNPSVAHRWFTCRVCVTYELCPLCHRRVGVRHPHVLVAPRAEAPQPQPQTAKAALSSWTTPELRPISLGDGPSPLSALRLAALGNEAAEPRTLLLAPPRTSTGAVTSPAAPPSSMFLSGRDPKAAAGPSPAAATSSAPGLPPACALGGGGDGGGGGGGGGSALPLVRGPLGRPAGGSAERLDLLEALWTHRLHTGKLYSSLEVEPPTLLRQLRQMAASGCREDAAHAAALLSSAAANIAVGRSPAASPYASPYVPPLRLGERAPLPSPPLPLPAAGPLTTAPPLPLPAAGPLTTALLASARSTDGGAGRGGGASSSGGDVPGGSAAAAAAGVSGGGVGGGGVSGVTSGGGGITSGDGGGSSGDKEGDGAWTGRLIERLLDPHRFNAYLASARASVYAPPPPPVGAGAAAIAEHHAGVAAAAAAASAMRAATVGGGTSQHRLAQAHQRTIEHVGALSGADLLDHEWQNVNQAASVLCGFLGPKISKDGDESATTGAAAGAAAGAGTGCGGVGRGGGGAGAGTGTSTAGV